MLATLTGLRELVITDNPEPCSQLAVLETALPDTRVEYPNCVE